MTDRISMTFPIGSRSPNVPTQQSDRVTTDYLHEFVSAKFLGHPDSSATLAMSQLVFDATFMHAQRSGPGQPSHPVAAMLWLGSDRLYGYLEALGRAFGRLGQWFGEDWIARLRTDASFLACEFEIFTLDWLVGDGFTVVSRNVAGAKGKKRHGQPRNFEALVEKCGSRFLIECKTMMHSDEWRRLDAWTHEIMLARPLNGKSPISVTFDALPSADILLRVDAAVQEVDNGSPTPQRGKGFIVDRGGPCVVVPPFETERIYNAIRDAHDKATHLQSVVLFCEVRLEDLAGSIRAAHQMLGRGKYKRVGQVVFFQRAFFPLSFTVEAAIVDREPLASPRLVLEIVQPPKFVVSRTQR